MNYIFYILFVVYYTKLRSKNQAYSKKISMNCSLLRVARAKDVFTKQVVIAVVFGNHVVAVIQVPSSVVIDFLFNAPTEHVMFAANRNR